MKFMVLSFVLAGFVAISSHAASTNGFAVKFTTSDGKSSDVMVLPNLWLYVEGGKPATPFLPPGNFTAVFEGQIVGDLRANYFFKTEELRGSLKLEINGAVVLEASSPAITKAVQINKGPNAVRATFTSATQGDSFLRVGWTEKGTNVNPIPNGIITHASSPTLGFAQRIHLGRELFLENRCVKCHAASSPSPVPELAMDAPSFEGIGARRNSDWLAKWILNPKATRAGVQMPKLLHGPGAKGDAEAMAAYLASLTSVSERSSQALRGLSFEESVQTNAMAASGNRKAIEEISKRSGLKAQAVSADGTEQPVDASHDRKPLFERLHCVACHNAPDQTETDPAKISLKHVGEKFRPGKLAEFLRAPEWHFAWIRMPNFKLAEAEAQELSAFLMKHADAVESKPATIDKDLVAKGRGLVQSVGCLNCHTAPNLENLFTAAELAKITPGTKGCLAEKRDAKSKAPDFAFGVSEREALAAFIKNGSASLSRHSPLEFAAREARLLNCAACHGQIDLVPDFDVLGGKVKPEWAARFIGGEPFKMRADIHPKGEPWVESRMPAFRSRAQLLAEAMAMQQGYPGKTPLEGPVDEEAARNGHKMIGKDNGLSCISCHAVNELPALEVFESEGTNLGLTASRLLKSYFFRWMRSPLAVDPQTKMPAYFEDGKSALTDYYDGDAEKQINALYEYIRLADKMPAPSTGQ